MIEMTDICKSYGDLKVLDGFSCQIETGSTTCIMGPSGRGKTTLLRIMMGLESADSGEIDGLKSLRKSVVFQGDRLCENLSAASNISLVCVESVAREQIYGSMQEVGLSYDCMKKPVRQMSGGERRRVEILRALYAEYDILFLDEPFRGLDSETRCMVIQYVRAHTEGKTVVIVTHDSDECEAMGGRCLII